MLLHSFYCLECNCLNNLHWDQYLFFYYKYMNHDKENVSVYDYVYHAKSY